MKYRAVTAVALAGLTLVAVGCGSDGDSDATVQEQLVSAVVDQLEKVDGVNAAARQLQNVSDGNRNNVLLSDTGYVVGELGCSPEEAVEFANKWFPAACRTEEYAKLDDVVRRMAEEGVRKWETTDWDLEDE